MDISNEKAVQGLEVFAQNFHNDRVQELKDIKSFYQAENLQKIKAIAHKWKGYSAPYGFNTLEKLSIELENETIKENKLKVGELIEQIENYLNLKRKYLH